MKVVHVPFSFHPDPIGGTEVYVEALARQQQLEGITPIVAAPGPRDDAYAYRGLKVCRFRVTERVDDIRELYGEGDPQAAASFAGILDNEAPDVVHLHAFTRGASLRLVREAKRRGIPVVFNYHTPTVSCQRGTLLHWGADVCDGALDVRTCTQCSLHGLGLSRPLSAAAGWVPAAVGEAIGALGASGSLWTALRATELVTLRHATFRRLMCEADHVVALCQWVRDLLVRNGVPGSKVTVSRQGLWGVQKTADIGSDRQDRRELPLRIMFLGRLDPTKGAHILIEAIRSVPDLPVVLAIYGVVQGETNRVYLERLKQLAMGEGRIEFRDAIPPDNVVVEMQHYDVLAVPSQWLETGPLVVMEAFAAGIPVVGSRLGGVGELVSDGVDGLLVAARSIEAWRTAFEALCRDRKLLSRLRRGIRQPRHIAEVASDMLRLYTRICTDRQRRTSLATRPQEGTLSTTIART